MLLHFILNMHSYTLYSIYYTYTFLYSYIMS